MRAGGSQQQLSGGCRFCLLPRRTLYRFSSASIKIVFAIRHAGREKPFRAALHECGAGHPFPQFKMKPFRDESLRCGSIIFGKLTICPNREHHVFGHNRLRYRNSPTRRRNEAAQIKNVVHQTAVIGKHTCKPVSLFRCEWSSENRDWDHTRLFGSQEPVRVRKLRHGGVKSVRVALSPFGNQSLQLSTSHGRKFYHTAFPKMASCWRFQARGRITSFASFAAPSMRPPIVEWRRLVGAVFHRSGSRCAPFGRRLRRPEHLAGRDGVRTLPVPPGSRSGWHQGGVPQLNFSRFAFCSLRWNMQISQMSATRRR